MTDSNNHSQSPPLISAGDTEAVRHLEQAITNGKHWYIALLEAIGLWQTAEESYNGHTYRYLIASEAFDWLLLAERLCQAVDGPLPDDEKTALLFYGKPPLNLTTDEFRQLIGSSKYHQYLNYFYGITTEEALVRAVREEVFKERWILGNNREQDHDNEAYRRIYSRTKTVLLKHFRREKGYHQLKSIKITELKEFTYWLFKYRLDHCDRAKVASDTKKALNLLKRSGFSGNLGDPPIDNP